MTYLCYSIAEAAETVGLTDSVLVRLSHFFKIPRRAYTSAGYAHLDEELTFTREDIAFFRDVNDCLLAGESLQDVKKRLLQSGQPGYAALEASDEAASANPVFSEPAGTAHDSLPEALPESMPEPAAGSTAALSAVSATAPAAVPESDAESDFSLFIPPAEALPPEPQQPVTIQKARRIGASSSGSRLRNLARPDTVQLPETDLSPETSDTKPARAIPDRLAETADQLFDRYKKNHNLNATVFESIIQTTGQHGASDFPSGQRLPDIQEGLDAIMSGPQRRPLKESIDENKRFGLPRIVRKKDAAAAQPWGHLIDQAVSQARPLDSQVALAARQIREQSQPQRF